MDMRRDAGLFGRGGWIDNGHARRSVDAPTSEEMPVTALMRGRRGLIMGVANDHSIAWGIAKVLAEHGAELAFTYQGAALGKRVGPLAKSLGSDLVVPCDVDSIESLDAAFAALDAKWDHIDFVVHAIAFSEKNELKGLYADTSRENFSRTMLISCFSWASPRRRSRRASATWQATMGPAASA
jgi:enoyl-[acyl-carrier protein] reductase I